jgi:hypothetical protein
MTHKFPRFVLTLSLLAVLASGLLSACSAKPAPAAATGKQDIQMAAMDGMPDEVKAAPPKVQQAYQFAVANPDVMKHIPCYCGCGAMGHTSNYSCYVASAEPGQKIKYDTHALGCSICVDITLDTMRLLKEGKSVQEIKAYVDQTYSQYGPSNIK